jgi:hypothetical protein
LDIGFREDDCQIKETNAVENLAAIRHIGLNLLKQETSCCARNQNQTQKSRLERRLSAQDSQLLMRLPYDWKEVGKMFLNKFV